MPTMEQLRHLVSMARTGYYGFGTEHCIIAGGAPRDILNDVEVKDIDIFVRIDEENMGEGDDTWFCKGARNLASAISAADELTFPENADYPELFEIARIQSAGGLVEIIGVPDDPIEQINSYDFSISQVFVTPTMTFQSVLCAMDNENDTIRYLGGEHIGGAQQLRSALRLRRLRKKYPTWMTLNCEDLDLIELPPEEV